MSIFHLLLNILLTKSLSISTPNVARLNSSAQAANASAKRCYVTDVETAETAVTNLSKFASHQEVKQLLPQQLAGQGNYNYSQVEIYRHLPDNFKYLNIHPHCIAMQLVVESVNVLEILLAPQMSSCAQVANASIKDSSATVNDTVRTIATS